MNDELPPHVPETDELASAYLDGEVDQLERARVEADEGIVARVAELAEVRDLVATPVPPLAPDRREVMIRAAVAATERDEEPATAPVIPLEGRRHRHRVLRVLAPVAAVAAAIGAVAFLARDDRSDDMGTAARSTSVEQDTSPTSLAAPSATAAPEPVEAEQATEAADSGGGADRSVPAAPATEAPAAGATLAARAFADLGEVSTADELAARLRQRTSEGGQAADDTVQGVIALWACPDEPGTVIGTVVYAGQRALVLITDRSLYVVLDQECTILATVTVGP